MKFLSELPVGRCLVDGFFLEARKRCVWIFMIIVACLLGCAAGPKLVWHTLSINGWFDGWGKDVVLLEYRYGDKYRMTSEKNEKGVGHSWSFNAPMPVGEFLYVRWRLKATNEVFEKRVNLVGELPKEMLRVNVTFVIDGKELYVFVVMPEKVDTPLDKAPLRTWRSRFRKTYEIYPNNDVPR